MYVCVCVGTRFCSLTIYVLQLDVWGGGGGIIRLCGTPCSPPCTQMVGKISHVRALSSKCRANSLANAPRDGTRGDLPAREEGFYGLVDHLLWQTVTATHTHEIRTKNNMFMSPNFQRLHHFLRVAGQQQRRLRFRARRHPGINGRAFGRPMLPLHCGR